MAMPGPAARQSPPEDMIRIGTVMGVPSVLESLGQNPREVLSGCGLDPAIFDDADNRITFTAQNRMLEYCAEKSNCQHFGLLTGQLAGLYSLGLLGLLMSYCPDVVTALNVLVRYFHLHAHGPKVTLQVRDDIAIFEYQVTGRRGAANHQLFDGAIAVMVKILRELCGPGWKPIEARLVHSEPEDIAPYRKFFQGRQRFNSVHNAVVFHSSYLRVTLPEARSDLRQMVQKQIDSLAEQHADDFPEQVRTVLRAAQLSGNMSAGHVAGLFSMHPRTLHRHLATYGVGYRELLEGVRFEMAQLMLLDSRLLVGEIAAILHYADARSFIRAFRRWSGDTPARWRAAERQQRSTSAR